MSTRKGNGKSDILKQLEDKTDRELGAKQYQATSRALASKRVEVARQKKQIRELLDESKEFAEFREIFENLKANPFTTHTIERRETVSRLHEGTAVLMLSDLHFEEEVKPEEVNGLNAFNLEISRQRMDRLADGFRWHLDLVRDKYKVRDIVCPLLGDNITNYLRPEDMITNLLTPSEAMIFARDRICELFATILEIDGVESLFAPMIVGNHDRMPGMRKIHHRGKTGMSMAPMLLHFIKDRFRDDPRVKVELSASANHYFEIYGHTVGSSHGDDFSYNKGTGGIFVPARRWVSAMNASRHAHLRMFGHWHQHKRDRNWISNGSLIGYSPFAIRCNAEFEPASQTFLLLDAARGPKFVTPIQVQEAEQWS